MCSGTGAIRSSSTTASDRNVASPNPATRSPTATVETSSPTSITRPQSSPPSSSSKAPSAMNMSRKFSPTASIATRTSRGASACSGSGSIRSCSSAPPSSGLIVQPVCSGSGSRSGTSATRTSRAPWRYPVR